MLRNPVVQEAGMQAHSQKFWFVKNLDKFPENPGKIPKYLGQIQAKMAPSVVCLQKMVPNLCRNTKEDVFGGTPKKVFMIFVGENLQANVAQQLFGQVWGKSGKDHLQFAPPKICLLLHVCRNPWFISVCCFLDVSKAFDRVLHLKLFKNLIQRKVEMCFVPLLKHWHKEQTMQTEWRKYLSKLVLCYYGVRQRGVFSPYLLAIY